VSDKSTTPNFHDEYERESVWAAQHNISQRTAARYRRQGLPWLEWGGEIWIPRREGREYIAGRVKRRNPPRRRRQANTPAEMST